MKRIDAKPYTITAHRTLVVETQAPEQIESVYIPSSVADDPYRCP